MTPQLGRTDKKMQRKVAIITATTLAMAVIVLVTWRILYLRSPEGVVQTFQRSIGRGDCSEAFEMMTERAKESLEKTYGDSGYLCRQVVDSGRRPRSTRILRVEGDGDTRTVTVITRTESGTEFEEKFVLRKEGGSWKVEPNWV